MLQVLNNRAKNKNIYLINLENEFYNEFKKVISHFINVQEDNNHMRNITPEEILNNIQRFLPIRNCFIEFLNIQIVKGEDTTDFCLNFLTNLFNDFSGSQVQGNSGWERFDDTKFIIWESLLCIIAILYYYKKYNIIYEVVTNKYLVKRYVSISDTKVYVSIDWFRPVVSEIQNYGCNKDNHAYYSYASDILVKREIQPIITKESLSFADILLANLTRYLGTSYFQNEDNIITDETYS